jgi:hypothetical protein
LISHNADVNAVDKNGDVPLIMAINKFQYRDMTEVVDLLLSNGANVNAVNVYRRTPLYQAIEQSQYRDTTPIIQRLIKQKADVNAAATYYAATPLTLALTMNKNDIADLLIKNHANIDEDAIQTVLLKRIGKDYVKSILKKASDEVINAFEMKGSLDANAKDLINREKLWRARRNAIAFVNGLPSDNQLPNYFFDPRFKDILEYMGPEGKKGGYKRIKRTKRTKRNK